MRNKYLQIRLRDGHALYPNELKGWYFPNWFDKSHFEKFMSRKLTDLQFERLKEYLSDKSDIDDMISQVVADYVTRGDVLKDIKDVLEKK